MEPIEILLVEDSMADARLTQEAMKETKMLNRLAHVTDGVEALEYLRKQGEYSDAATPDLVLLDLNLPRLDGREVLAEIKQDVTLRHIPVVVLTTSNAEEDVLRSYNLHANCYITKPIALDQFMKVVREIESFWLSIVRLP
ncbi:MAG: response regulator [Pseudomonadota bacterium]|nr:response regulator [Pseudomonadota bacterium]